LRCVNTHGATIPIDFGGTVFHLSSTLGFTGPANSSESSRYESSRK
jgi:hypothetical protein